jgi:putative heme-binding domain-containing protein
MDLQSLSFVLFCLSAAGGPEFLEDRFEIPAGFRIYRAAGPELSGGSYDLAFDGEGRLLVGDGTQVRRLEDRDGDGVYDHFEVIAGGLGPRGPQGLLVYGDRLYAVGGDGIQLFEGYRSGGPLVKKERIGNRFGTGGDHDAHAILRGHDGYLYFISGDGGGTRDRVHITEESSPGLFERSSTVFRISPDGKRWEVVGSGGRNAPNVGINWLGDLFSLDSDMEWHVDLPWYRPVRLHHWTAGGDQGWQDVGAYPPYYLDNLPGIHDIGRGSPDWGLFYEHRELPPRYHDAYLLCDYQSKSATTGGYETSGRLFAFFLERDGAGWKATSEVLARPRPGAKDESGKPISFALVDIEVAPDGSLLLSDHNQGIWRIFYDPEKKLSAAGAPPLIPKWPPLPSEPAKLVDTLLDLPQPGSEWCRLREEEIRKALGADCDARLKAAALDPAGDLRRRLRALRLLAPGFAELPQGFLEGLARDRAPEIRGQAAWLSGIRGKGAAASLLLVLIDDEDPFVRRRAAEALARIAAPEAIAPLMVHLSDPVRLVRYTAMTALAHHPTSTWFQRIGSAGDPQAVLRGLAAAVLRREPPPAETVRRVVGSLIARRSPGDSRENRLDLLRILGLYARQLREEKSMEERIGKLLVAGFPDPDHDIRWEHARLLGEYRVAEGFGKLLQALLAEKEPVEQFHLAQALSRLPAASSEGEEERAVGWFLSAQRGWFTEFSGKGLEFPHFWATVLAEFGAHHKEALIKRLPEIDLASQLGGVTMELLAQSQGSAATLIALYRANENPAARRRILPALGGLKDPAAGALLRDEYLRLREPEVRGVILRALSGRPPEKESLAILLEGLLHQDQEIARSSARALAGYGLEPTEELARLLLGRMAERPGLFHAVERLLVKASGRSRPDYRADADPGHKPEEPAREAGLAYWKGWYRERFGKSFEATKLGGVKERSDEEVRNLLLGEAVKGGDAERGRKVYEAVRCASCHGGGSGKDERIFGPDLSGVTRRLSRVELVDSLVDPSKQVADRFKAKVVQVRGGVPLTGFITDENEEAVTLVDPDRVHRIPRKSILSLGTQETSLMPERLLNRLSDGEIRDLFAFLEAVGARPDPEKPAPPGK